jgi:chromate transporter
MGDRTETREASLREIAWVFLKLGTIAFGGPAAHLAMMEEEFVRRHGWITHAEFLDRLATANLIPGPSSTEVAIFVGQLKRGWRGLIVAGCCFILPAALIVTALAWVYVRFGALPKVEGALSLIKPAVVAIVVDALWKLGRTGLKTVLLVAIAVLAAVASYLGFSPVLLLLIAGLVSAAVSVTRNRIQFSGAFIPSNAIWLKKAFCGSLAFAVVSVVFPVTLTRLFLSFLKIGSVVFGSGYVLLPMLQAEFVRHLHWLSEKQLIDAVAVGQFTPGPLFTTATFIGYVVAGWAGALVATIGIFLPGFLLVAVSGPWIPRLRSSPVAAVALDGVIAASLGLIAAVAWTLGKSSIINVSTLIVFLASLTALFWLRFNSAWLVLAVAVVGWIVH